MNHAIMLIKIMFILCDTGNVAHGGEEHRGAGGESREGEGVILFHFNLVLLITLFTVQ